MTRTLALLALMTLPTGAVSLSLTGIWTGTFSQGSQCDKGAALAIKAFHFELLDAPWLNRSASTFDYKNANVTGSVSMRVQPANGSVETSLSGMLIGALVKKQSGGTFLQGYVVTGQQYSDWVAHKGNVIAPSSAGEVELQVDGSMWSGYTLTGLVRSGDSCTPTGPLDAAVRDLVGQFGRSVPSTWAFRAALKKQ